MSAVGLLVEQCHCCLSSILTGKGCCSINQVLLWLKNKNVAHAVLSAVELNTPSVHTFYNRYIILAMQRLTLRHSLIIEVELIKNECAVSSLILKNWIDF